MNRAKMLFFHAEKKVSKTPRGRFEVGLGRVILTMLKRYILYRRDMLEELQTLLLVGLLVSTYYLTIGCRSIGESMPLESGNITEKVGDATEVLDDIANLLNEGLSALSGNGTSQTIPSPMESILTAFMGRITSPPEHGPKQEIWEVRKDDPPPTHETKDQFD